MALNSVISWFVKKRIHQIELFKKYPIEVQDELLMRLIRSAQYTEWGNKHNYKDISSVEEYKSRFPVQRYEDVLPYVLRMQEGRQNLLWPNEIRWFAKSSGTTRETLALSSSDSSGLAAAHASCVVFHSLYAA